LYGSYSPTIASPTSSSNYLQILAIGFLLVILSCALFKQYLPLLVVATYVLAPLPNWICGRCANPDDFGDSGSGNAIVDFGRFLTGFLVVMGIGECFSICEPGERGPKSHDISVVRSLIKVWKRRKPEISFIEKILMRLQIALPAVLAHSEIIRVPAMLMSIVGGVLIYGTIISFGMFFQEEQEF
jgi:hypothetical protein